MKEEEVFFTNWKCFTQKEAEEQFGENLSFLNLRLLLPLITNPESASYIEGFTEHEGMLLILIEGDFVAVTGILGNWILYN